MASCHDPVFEISYCFLCCFIGITFNLVWLKFSVKILLSFRCFENLIAVHAVSDSFHYFLFGKVCDFENEVDHVFSLAFSSHSVQIWELFTRKKEFVNDIL